MLDLLCYVLSHAVSIPSLGEPTKFTFIKVLCKESQISLKKSLAGVLSWLEMMMGMPQ